MDNAQPSYGDVPADAAPTCPRHPDRESRIRCQRCNRPVCVECQRPSSVGVQCVDCVAEAARSVPTQRTIFGGEVRRGRPVVTITLIAVCVAIWLLQLLPGLGDPILQVGAFMPALGLVEPWRFVTAAFLHASAPWHLLFNMLCLWMLGPMVEFAIGRARYVAAYLLCAVGGSVGFMWFSPPITDPSSTWMQATVGASGAVFGLFALAMVLLRSAGREVSGVIGFLVINAVLPFFLPGIAWQAHLGGFLTGLAVGGAMLLYRKRPSAALQWAALGGIAVLLVALAAVKYVPMIAAIG